MECGRIIDDVPGYQSNGIACCHACLPARQARFTAPFFMAAKIAGQPGCRKAGLTHTADHSFAGALIFTTKMATLSTVARRILT